jgi:ketosteroid isomerase-like protein
MIFALRKLEKQESAKWASKTTFTSYGRLLAAFQCGDLRALLDLCSQDVVIQHPIPKEILPFASISHGKREAKRFYVGMAERFNLNPFQPSEFIALGNNVAVIIFERSTNRATGRTVDNEYVHI